MECSYKAKVSCDINVIKLALEGSRPSPCIVSGKSGRLAKFQRSHDQPPSVLGRAQV
ncbi:hypothetical protein FOPG_17566 [Fusarium oxysporum f. sp. conglutinans race 2 54008]|uniref:Uncharacterized protein n=1 Tax=Fusarium oxysporum f. sp. conglutinans race 2 54008 TaxID=1089457 RepID=X0H2G7_FUSOX|nr:hypothetical protein FOPG_17566 [Fusarium oxysporum f. sp. conglutinans race 2 54008]